MNQENTEQSVQYAVQENVSSGSNARKLMLFPFPLLVVAAYLGLGFLWDLWHPGWLIFLSISMYYPLAAMAAVPDIRKKLNAFPIAQLCVLAYLLLGFFAHAWHPTWLVFLLIPVYYILVNAAFAKKA